MRTKSIELEQPLALTINPKSIDFELIIFLSLDCTKATIGTELWNRKHRTGATMAL
jgi:hypothetical protein